MSCALGDDSRMSAGVAGRVNAVEWMKGWEEGVTHVFNRLADGVSVDEVRREVQIILETHRGPNTGTRRPTRRRAS